MRHATYLGGAGYTELGEKTFRKQVLRKGSWIHPNNPSKRMEITDSTLSAMVDNFKKGVVQKVSVPWTHTDDASKNTGYVIGLEQTPEGLDALITFSDDGAAGKAAKGEIPGVSCGLDFDYVVKDTSVSDVGGKHIGPTLLHVALVNHPYIKGMGDFEPVTLSEDGVSPEPLIMLSDEEGEKMTQTELIAALKDTGIDVEALKVEAAKVPNLEAQVGELTPKAELSEQIVSALGEGKVALSEGGPVAAVKALVGEIGNLKAEKLAGEAEKSVGVLLSEGKITPAQKDKFTKLFLSDRGMFDDITADMPKVIDLSEKGQEQHTETTNDEAEIQRLTNSYAK